MEQKQKKNIILEDGTIFTGDSFGSDEDKMIEIVFNTSMVGYQEIISDPSYTDQAVVMTYPLMGNYGMCDDDYETETPTIGALICREYCDDPSNFRCTKTLGQVMKEYSISGVQGIDTRKLARHIRNYGSCKAYIVDAGKDTEEALKELRSWIPRTDMVARVSTKKIYTKTPQTVLKKVVAIDCGMKQNIVRELVKHGCEVTVVPWNTSADEIMAYEPDGVFISNGPGDPETCVPTIETIRTIIGRIPIFGICLGHQIIALASGAETYKLKFGHRGGNHPVKNLRTGKVEITSQNHSFAVKEETLKGTGLSVSHINLLDNTVEGIECPEKYVFSVQYHPESAPGPQDSSYLFDRFMNMMDEFREDKKNA